MSIIQELICILVGMQGIVIILLTLILVELWK